MNRVVKINKGAAPALLALVMVLGSLLPAVVPTASAASFNASGSPYKLVRGLNFTEEGPNCTTCWEDTVYAEIGDTVSIRVLVHNDSNELATDARVSIIPNVASDGESVLFTGRVWADNAGSKSGSVRVYANSGTITDLDHVTTFVNDGFGNSKSFSGDAEDVTESGGLDIGDINAGGENLRWVVARFEVNGDADDNDDDDDEDEDSDGPEVTTRNAEDIDDNSAELVCDVEAGDEDTDVWFEWGDDDDDLDEETSDETVDANDDDTIGITITGLDEDTKYFFRCVAEDDDGNDDEGSVKSFTTDDEDDDSDENGNEPDVTTLSATGVNTSSATLRGEVDPNGDDTDAWFEWGTSSSNLNRTTSKQDVGDGSNDVSFSANISGLSANTTYFFRAVAENDEGDDEGSILSFRTETPVVNVVTRFVDIFREVEVEEPEEEALIITLNADSVDVDGRTIDYVVSYDNRTRLFLTDAELTVELPNELEFIDSDPNPTDDRGDELFYRIGRIEAGEEGSFLIETRLDESVDANDLIRLVAHVEYNDDSSVRKIVEVIDEHTFGELVRGGGFTAAIIDAFRGLFTNPLLWIILFILLVTFAVRYMLSARDRRVNTLV